MEIPVGPRKAETVAFCWLPNPSLYKCWIILILQAEHRYLSSGGCGRFKGIIGFHILLTVNIAVAARGDHPHPHHPQPRAYRKLTNKGKPNSDDKQSCGINHC